MGGMCRSLAQYACRIKRTGHRKEIVDDIDQDIKALLQLFKQRNGVKPESIVVYRDGVSQGEFREVRCILTPSRYIGHHLLCIDLHKCEMSSHGTACPVHPVYRHTHTSCLVRV
jgi:hypothetical protein